MLRIWLAFKNSLNGLRATYLSEVAFRQELALGLIVIGLIYYLPFTLMQKLFLGLCLLLVFIIELINTAIEVIIDRISPEINQLSKIAKDIGSAIVLLTIIFNVIAWFAILNSVYHFTRLL